MNHVRGATLESRVLTRLRIDLGYDGTYFSGWAKQPGLRTVQDEVETALGTLLRTNNGGVQVTVGGRTDAGVHARGQVCHVDVGEEGLARIRGRAAHSAVELPTRALNGILRRNQADDIVIHRVRIVPQAFDARFSALSRRYEYRLQPAGVRRDPLARGYTVQVPHSLNIHEMRDYSRSLLGLRDFAAFCKAREGATTVRTLTTFDWDETPDGTFVARIEADAFCHSMVRSLIGAVTAIGGGRMSAAELDEVVRLRKRSSRFPVMPARGLSLEEIRYPLDAELAARAQQTRARRTPLDEFPVTCG